MTNRSSWMAFLAKACLSLLLTGYLIQHVGFSALSAAFRGPSAVAVTISCVLLTAYFGLSALRWAVVLRTLGHNIDWRQLVRITLVGQFLSQFLPSSLGADMLRVWQSARAGLPTNVSFSSVFLDRVTYFSGLCILGFLLFAVRLEPHFPSEYVLILAALAGLATIGSVLLTVIDRVPTSWMPPRLSSGVRSVGEGSRKVYSSPSCLLWTSALLILGQAAFAGTLMVLGPEFGVELNAADALSTAPLIVLASAVPVSVAGWGVREAAMISMLTHLGVNGASALQLSLTLGVLSIIASLPGAAMLAYGKRPGV